MTAGAIYSYYANRDELIDRVITDVYGALADTMEAAYDSVPAAEPGAEYWRSGRAYGGGRSSIPRSFRLI